MRTVFWFVLAFLLAFDSIDAGDRAKPIEVLVKPGSSVALIPAGTQIPTNIRVYADMRKEPRFARLETAIPEAIPELRRTTIDVPVGTSGRKRAEVLRAQGPLTFREAPDEIFEPHRQRSRELLERMRAMTGYCWDPIVVYQSEGGYEATHYSTSCVDPYPTYGNDAEFTFISEVTPAHSTDVYVESSDSYFSCAAGAASPTENVSCSDNDFRTLVGYPATYLETGALVEFFTPDSQVITFDFLTDYDLFSVHAQSR